MADEVKTLDDAGPKSEPEKEKIAWDISFVAVMSMPVQNTGRWYYDKEAAKEAAQQAFLDYLREEHDIENVKILSFEIAQEDEADTALAVAEAPSQAIN